MDVNELIKSIDKEVSYLESTSFIEKASKEENMDEFIKLIKSYTEKNNLENSLIYLASKEELKDYEKSFLDKYNKYLLKILENDPKEYYNNSYCSFLYTNALNKLTSKEELYKTKFINGKSLGEIDDILANIQDKLLQDIKDGKELSQKSRYFLEESILLFAFENIILKEYEDKEDTMFDIVMYFNKYSIHDISTSRNKQLSILAALSQRMIKFSGNNAIRFNLDDVLENDKYYRKGSLGVLPKTNIPYIEINGMDSINLSNEESFLEKMFTIFHELGHLRQKKNLNEFDENMLKIFKLEGELINNCNDFYIEYHDSFFVERDADNYAITELKKEYGEKYPTIVNDIISHVFQRKRIEPNSFYQMELKKYAEISQNNQKKK